MAFENLRSNINSHYESFQSLSLCACNCLYILRFTQTMHASSLWLPLLKSKTKSPRTDMEFDCFSKVYLKDNNVVALWLSVGKAECIVQ
jgi:hypothetical protein